MRKLALFLFLTGIVLTVQAQDSPVCGDYPRDGASCNLPSVWWHRFINDVCEEDVAVRKVPSQGWSPGRCPEESGAAPANASDEDTTEDHSSSVPAEIGVLLEHVTAYMEQRR